VVGDGEGPPSTGGPVPSASIPHPITPASARIDARASLRFLTRRS
jgi:hypothetical protein